MDIHFPTSKDEQIAIANILTDMDAEMELLQELLTKYKSVKQGMMQKLLTVKVRLTWMKYDN